MDLAAEFPGVFFRPEEDTFLSEGINDVGFFQTTEIDLRNKNERAAFLVLAMPIHGAINLQLQRPMTVGTFRGDMDGQVPFFQSPLHEGRSEGVDRSGGVDLFPGVEGNKMRGLFNCQGIGPGDLSQLIPVKESQMFFQIL
jgi:hypothetical protein